MNDLISRQAAIDALNEEYHGMISDESMKIYKIIEWLGDLPSAQPESCEGCKWENAFGYGECGRCRRRLDDMYEREACENV